MTKPALPIEGTCRCGDIRIRISAPPMITMACHCHGCQRMSASAFSCSAAIPSDGFELITGNPVIGGAHGDEAHHYHCPRCKSWLFTRPAGMDWFVNIRPTMLDDTTWFSPFIETYASVKFAWAETGARHSFAEFPTFDAYPQLMKEYAEQAGNSDASPG